MDTSMLIEVVGYVGSILVVVAMMMTSIVRLRVVNSIGCVIFATYAFIIQSFPTVFMNLALVAINIYNLKKLMKKEQSFDLVESGLEDNSLKYMLQYYKEDILQYFPGFAGKAGLDVAYLVYCQGNPAGVLLGKDEGNGVIRVTLDYSVPEYRDCSVGTYLYAKLPSQGVRKLVYGEQETQTHVDYLLKMGFVKEQGEYCKILDK